MNKVTVAIIVYLLTSFYPFLSVQADNDAPHAGGSNISCSSCHGDAIVNSPFWGKTINENTYNNFCLITCHNAANGPYTDTSAPRVKSHSSQTTSDRYGVWSISCIDCHNAHTQDQKTWQSTKSAELYLAKGTISLPLPVYDPTTKTSTLKYSVINYKAGWDANALTQKSNAGRQAILLPNTKKLGFSFSVIAIDATSGTIKVAGDARPAYAYINPPTSFAIIYGQFISRSINVNGTAVPVTFLDKTGKNSFAFDESGIGIDPSPTGICQVCHTQTSHWRKDGTLSAIGIHAPFNGANCMTCHPHSEGFKTSFPDHSSTGLGYVADAAKCVSCHTGPDPIINTHKGNCLHCHLSDLAVKPGLSGGDCGNCHTAYAANFENGHQNEDHANVVATTNATPTLNCAGCHTGNLISGSQNHKGNCNDCHTDKVTNGSLRSGPLGSATGHTIGVASGCVACHAADYFSNHTHNHTVSQGAGDTSQNSGAACSICHHDSGNALATWADIFVEHKSNCALCHNATRNTSESGSYSIGATIQTVIAANGATTCASCHRDKIDIISADATHGIDHKGAGKVIGTPLCQSCHDSGGKNSNAQFISVIHGSCNKCHIAASGAGPLRDYSSGGSTIGQAVNYEAINGGAGGTCAQCHTAYFTGHSHDHTATVKVNVDSTPITSNCVGCHSATTAPFTGGGEVHQDDGCMTCHSADTGARIGSAVNGTGECKNCHTTHFAGHDHGVAGGQINHTIVTGVLDLGQANSQPCNTCHTSADWAGVFATHKSSCDKCHNSIRDINPSAPTEITISDVITRGDNPTTCLSCHMKLKAPFQHMDHVTPGYVVVSASCVTTACHSGATIEPVMETHLALCTPCHTAPNVGDYGLKPGSLAAGHAPATPDNPYTCTICHVTDFTTTHTPLLPNHVISSNTSCTQCHGGLTTWAEIKTLHGTCVKCHTSARPEVIATINDGNSDTCYECHAPHNPIHLVTAAGGCESCHGTLTTWAEIEAVHQPVVGNACGTCHTSQRAEVRAAITAKAAVTCVTCHTAAPHDLVADHTDLATTPFCVECHILTNGTMIDIDQLHDRSFTTSLTSCETCHTAIRETGTDSGITIPQVIKGVGAKTCLSCHTDLTVNHPGGFGNHAGVKYSPQCQVCHTGANIVADIHKGNCALCHNPQPTLRAGVTSGDCMHCHGTHHSATHVSFVGTPSCNRCHPNANYEQIAALHNNDDCSVCHKNSDPAVVAAIANGKLGVQQNCTSCHVYAHHTNAHAQKGDCAFCHADPRPGWENTHNTPLPSPLPYQMACRECHVEKTGTGLVVYKNTYFSKPNPNNPLTATVTFPSGTRSLTIAGAATVSKTPVHTIASTSNQKINVYNYGACMDCHGVRQLLHGKPRVGEYPTPDPANVATFPYDTLRNAPGRSIFNEFKSDFRLPYRWLRNNLQRSPAAYDRGFYFMTAVNSGTQPWNWGSVAHLSSSIPCIDAVNDPDNICNAGGSLSVPYFANLATPGSFPETIQFTRAVWNEIANGELTVHVTNQYLQNATMTLTYGAQVVNQPMTWNGLANHWELTVPSLTYLDTVTVTSVVAGNQTEVKAHYVADMTRDLGAVVVDHVRVKLDSVAECGPCHSSNNVTEHVTIRHKKCQSCHQSTDPTVMAGMALGRGGSDVYCVNCHGAQSEAIHRPKHVAVTFDAPVGAPQCDNCHEPDIITDHVDDRGWTCRSCHEDFRFGVAIANGKKGDPVLCSACHKVANASSDLPPDSANMAIVDGHWTPPDHAALGFVVMESPCNTCHDPAGTLNTVVDVHHDKCGLCHLAPPVLRTGLPATGGKCRDCHTDTEFHHKTKYAQAGDCSYCHAPIGIGSAGPYQMACRQCHVNSTATEFEVKKLDFSLMSGIRPTPIDSGLTHKIPNTSPSGTPIQIYDYKSCFSCHSGLNPGFPTAPVVTPFHGFPGDAKKGSATPVFNSAVINDSGSNPNVANMLPRVALYYHPGLETFRRFGSTFGKRAGSSDYRLYRTGTYFAATSLNDDTGLTTKVMAKKTGSGQGFSDGEYINWRDPNNINLGTGAIYAVPATGYGDKLASVAFAGFGAANGPYTNIPYFKSTLPPPGPYGEQISVIKADWNPITKHLIIWAVNDGLGDSQIFADGVPMTWELSKGRWVYEVDQPTYVEYVSLVSAANGSTTAHIHNSKDQLLLVAAEWDKNSVGSELHVQVENTSSTMLWADYATVEDGPMTNIGGKNWSLLAAAANKPYQVRIHSNNYGELTALVKDITFSWPPKQSGTITDLTNSSSWNRTTRNPDRLRVVVNVGADGRMPKMRLNGSGSSGKPYVDYPCTYVKPNYRCQVSDNALYNAGYDPYLVVYTGATPGEGSVLRYKINNWANDQIPLLPLTNLAPLAVDDAYVVPINSGAQGFTVLTNDSDPDAGTLSIASVGAPSNGGTAIKSGTIITYTPKSGYSGVEYFTYTISDGTDTATATVAVTVDNGVDDLPVAVYDSFTGITKGSTNNDLDVLANDDDPDPGDTLMILSVGPRSAGGSATINGNKIRYTPAASFLGIENFTYTIRDASGHTATAAVMVTVVIGPTDHTTFVVGAANCTRCHSNTAGNATTVPVSILDPLLHAACVTCHTASYTLKSVAEANNPSTDATVIAMPVVNGTCETCHGASYFSSHKNINHYTLVSATGKCQVCHSGTSGTVNGAPVNPTDPKIHDACTTCHNASTGYLLTTALANNAGTTATVTAMTGGPCTACHATYATGHRDTNHTALVAATANCTSCHTATAGVVSNVPININDNKVHDDCTTCHSMATGALLAPYGTAVSMPVGGGDCNACHGAFFANHTKADHVDHVAGTAACSGCHDATAGTAMSVPVDGVAGNKVHNGCNTCHNVTNGALLAPYGRAAAMPAGGGSCTACHTTYPDAHLHVHDVSHDPVVDVAQTAALACLECHDDAGLGGASALSTWAAIKLEHDLDDTPDGLGACATCHSYSDVDDGHSPPLATNHSVIASGVAVKCVTCHTEKISPIKHGGHPASNFGWDGACNTCHSGASIVKNVHANKCGICHVNVATQDYTRLAGPNGDALLADPLPTPRTATCLTCHPAATYPKSKIHHNSKMAANNNCGSCHASINHGATVANQAACTKCHTASGAAQGGVPTSLSDPTIHDSCRTCHTFDANRRSILVNFTNAKGVNGTGTLPDGGTIAGQDGGGLCTVCHTGATVAKTYHHALNNAKIGACDYCHADPRPSWSASRPGDNVGGVLTGAGSAMPTHLPCDECHVRWTGSAGNYTMTVNKFTRSVYTTLSAAWTTAAQHVLTGITANKINNYGICLSCHDGTKATKVQVWHARPDRFGGANWTMGTQRGARGGTESKYVAGKSSSGIGRFNLFFPNYKGSTKLSGGSQSYETNLTTYNVAGAGMPTKLLITVPNIAGKTQYSAPQTGTSYAVPIFAKAVQSAPTVSAASEEIEVRSAIYNAGAIVVTATSTGDCSVLTAAYGAVMSAMSGTTSCTATLTPVSYPANGTTVNVTTSNPAGINVMGYRISSQSSPSPGVLSFSTLNYSVNEGGGTATVTVSRMDGANGAVSVNYATANGTALAGTNYTATSGTLNWAAGEITDKTFTIPILENAIYQGNLTVNLALSGPFGATLAMPTTAVLTIVENEPAALFNFSAATYSVAEAGPTATITVTRTVLSTGAVTVNYATANGTATAGSDYTAKSGTLSWANGDMANKTFTISVQDDAVYQGPLTVNLALSQPTGASAIGDQWTAVLTITDSESPSVLALSAATYTVAETGTTATITVNRTGPSVGAVTAYYETEENGTAAAGLDYTDTFGTLSWAAGDAASKTFTIPITDDTVVDAAETVDIRLSAPTGPAIIGAQNTAALTITDNDSAIAFSAATYSIAEAGPTVTITATRTGPNVGAVSVNYATSNGTALAGTDYTAQSGTLSWATLDSANKTFTIPVADDAVYQGNLTVNLTLSATTGPSALGTQKTAVLTIVDSESPSVLALSAATFAVNELGPTATITATRTGPSVGAVTVNYAIADGTATVDSDYTATAGTLLWADGNATSKTFTIPITDDQLVEAAETINIALSDPTGPATIGAQATAVLTITDNDSTIDFSASTYTVAETGPTVTITATRTGPATGAVTVNYATSNGTALVGTDYTATSGTLSWATGITGNKTFTIPVTDDALYQGSLTVNLTLSAPTGPAAIGTQGSAVLTITDDESVLNFSAPAYAVNEAGTTATITVTRGGASVGGVGVTYATSDGTATAGSDYTTKTGTLSWLTGDMAAKTFTVTIAQDTIKESDELVNLTLSAPTGKAVVGSQGTSVLTIVDDEDTLNFSGPTYAVDENGGTALITVSRSGPAVGAVGVSYATSNGTALSTSDYTTKTGTLSWGAGDTADKSFTVSITNDTASEAAETVNLTLSTPTGQAVIGSQSTAVLTIADIADESTLDFSAPTYSVNEDGGTATIMVNRTGPAANAIGVSYATANGTATSGSDYTATSGTLSWAAADTAAKTFTIPITNDKTLLEPGETVNLTISTPTGQALIGTQSTAVLTIAEVADESTLNFSSPTYSRTEAGLTATITASRTGPAAGVVGVTYATSNGTAISGTDYTAATGTLSWAAGDTADKSFTVTITNDTTNESNETVNLTLSLPTGQAVLGGQSTAVLTIVDSYITALDGWTNLYSAAPGNTAATDLAVGSFTVSGGSQRLLLVSAVMSINTAANPVISAKYGGTALTQIGITSNTQKEIVWIGYLTDVQIGAGSQALQLTYSGATGNVRGLHVKWASYDGVDQASPVAGFTTKNTNTTTVATSVAVNYVKNGMTIAVAGNGGTPATGTLTPSVGDPAFTAGTATTSNTHTSRTFVTATETASGSYSATSGVSVAWTGTTAAWSGLVVVSLQP